MQGEYEFDQFIGLMFMDEEDFKKSWEEAANKTLDYTSKGSMMKIYNFLNEVLSKNYTEKELMDIWEKPKPNISFFIDIPKDAPQYPVKESFIWILMTTWRDMCGERLGLQEKRPRHPFVL